MARRHHRAHFVLGILLILSLVPASAIAAQPPPEPDRQPPIDRLHPLAVAAANSDSGAPIGSPFVLADMPADIAQPAIAYNSRDREYLVVWQTQGAVNPGNIWATRVAADGRRLGNYQVEAGGAIRSHPDVAYNDQDNDYYIVWQHDDGAHVTIRGKPFLPGGPDYGSAQLSTIGANEDCFEPAIAYATNPNPTDERFIVVWERHVFGALSSDIEGQGLSLSGGLAGGNFLIDTGTISHSYSQPDIAYNLSRNEYLVVYTWHDKTVPIHDILGRILTRDGTVLTNPAYLIGRYIPDAWAPAVAALPTVPDYGGYVVAWEFRYTPADGNIYARHVPGRMAADPTEKLGNPVIVSSVTQDQAAPAIAANLSNHHYLVSWVQDVEPPYYGDTTLHARELIDDATVWGPVRWVGGAFTADAAVAAGPAGDFLMAWTGVFGPGATDIYGRLWGRRVYIPLVLRNS